MSNRKAMTIAALLLGVGLPHIANALTSEDRSCAEQQVYATYLNESLARSVDRRLVVLSPSTEAVGGAMSGLGGDLDTALALSLPEASKEVIADFMAVNRLP